MNGLYKTLPINRNMIMVVESFLICGTCMGNIIDLLKVFNCLILTLCGIFRILKYVI